MRLTLTVDSIRQSASSLQAALSAFDALHPGEGARRQPVHTVYGGAHLFRADISRRLGERARAALDEYAPTAAAFAKAIGLGGGKKLVETVYRRVHEKLEREPVEDFRIYFEDGYGTRPDREEDGHAVSVAEEVAVGMQGGTLPPFIGIRIKPFSAELWERSVRTLDLFLTRLVEQTANRFPENFFVTLPKVSLPEQVAALAGVLEALEVRLGVASGALKIELMIETPQAILNARGEVNLLPLVSAARGRCVAAHFGTYDYTASLGITAAHQHMLHPACDFARQTLQVALAGTGVWLSDGATNVLPVAPHRAAPGGRLSPAKRAENRATIHRAWRLHYEHVRHSLERAFYQGWDLHPAQLPTRYAAIYSFFIEGVGPASERLRNFVAKAAQATLLGEVFDDAATGQGLLNFFLRAINCGAIAEEEALPLTGLTREELRMGSFVRIVKSRTKQA